MPSHEESLSGMTLYDHSEEPLALQAAALAFAMLEFEQDAAHQFAQSAGEGETLGTDLFLFLPSWISTWRAEVVPFLAQLSSPALLFQTTRRGAISLVLVEELEGERRAWALKTLDNHVASIEAAAASFFPSLTADARILLEIRGEAHVMSLDGARFWAKRFSCPVGWSMGEPRADAPGSVSAQIRLYSPDGRVSPPSHVAAPWERPGW